LVGTYDVTCKAGPSFRNRQEQTLRTMLELAQVDPSLLQLGGDLLLKNVVSPVADALAERRRAQMIAQGIIPEKQMTDEEKQELAMKMQSQGQAQDPNMVLAQAEMLKAQAQQMQAQNDAMKLQLENMKLQIQAQNYDNSNANSQIDAQIKAFDSETKRIDTQIKAEQAGARINLDNTSALSKQVDTQIKVAEAMVPPFMRQ
jgi:hypothetical protein